MMSSPFTPEFEARMKARQATEQAAARRMPVESFAKDVAPVHVMFTGATAAALRRTSGARRQSPMTMAKAIVASALCDGYAETALDELGAEVLAGGHGRRPVGAFGLLTLRQCAVVYLIGTHGGVKGWCGWSPTALARLMPDTISASNVQDALVALTRHKLIERGAKVGNLPRTSRLTELGVAVFDELAGDFDG